MIEQIVQIDTIIAGLHKLRDGLATIGDLEERAVRAKADLDSVNKSLAEAKRNLADAQMHLTKAHVDAQRRYEQEIYTKQGQLKDLSSRVDARQVEVTEVENDLNKKRAELNVVNSTVQEARRRLGL
jgi:chromosome segregation ATPase